MMLVLVGLWIFSCTTSHEPAQLQVVSFDNMDSKTVTTESKSVIGYTLNQTLEASDRNDEIVAAENAGTLGKAASEYVYTWNGEWHVWSKTESFNAFYAEFLSKVQYRKTNSTGAVVKVPSQANYMHAYSSVKGTWGFVDGSPYGTYFNNFIDAEWNGMKTTDYLITAVGQYKKENYCIYNGEDALLKYNVALSIDKLTMKKGVAKATALYGTTVFEMNPWKATVVCDGTVDAKVTISKDDVVVNSYTLNLQDVFAELVDKLK
jgi:hypothetical protein